MPATRGTKAETYKVSEVKMLFKEATVQLRSEGGLGQVLDHSYGGCWDIQQICEAKIGVQWVLLWVTSNVDAGS